MRKRNDIPSDIGDYLKYDETSKTGLRWKKVWGAKNQINIGDESGTLHHKGYYITGFNGKLYLNHRIVYFLHHGYCSDILDHLDCIRSNNNINNLREATAENNQQNAKLSKRNNTGIKGLSIAKNKYWRLQIRKNGKHVFHEIYKLSEKTKDECRVILENKRKEFHGQFANHG